MVVDQGGWPTPSPDNREYPFQPLDPNTIPEPVTVSIENVPSQRRCKDPLYFSVVPGKLFAPLAALSLKL